MHEFTKEEISELEAVKYDPLPDYSHAVELMKTAAMRLRFLQTKRHGGRHLSVALTNLETAILWLNEAEINAE
jgi:hypothetical protein